MRFVKDAWVGPNRGSIKHEFSRYFWLSLLIFLLGCQAKVDSFPPANITSEPHLAILGQRQYRVHQQVTLANEGSGQPEKQNIWVALIRDFSPYQTVQSMEISPKVYSLVTDEYGNQYAEFDFSKQRAGTRQIVNIDYRITVNEIAYDLSVCQGALPHDFTQPELHIESANPQIMTLAKDLSRDKTTVCQQVRAFYDYIGDKLVYTPNGKNWGAQAALGPMGSDCTEYASLLAALSRAQGIPARYFEGLRTIDQGAEPFSTIEHAWVDAYMPDSGWVALDPTLGQPLINRETYFAHYTSDHIIVTLGASPSVLRGSSYWTHLYWPGDSTTIRVSGAWKIEPADKAGSN